MDAQLDKAPFGAEELGQSTARLHPRPRTRFLMGLLHAAFNLPFVIGAIEVARDSAMSPSSPIFHTSKPQMRTRCPVPPGPVLVPMSVQWYLNYAHNGHSERRSRSADVLQS